MKAEPARSPIMRRGEDTRGSLQCKSWAGSKRSLPLLPCDMAKMVKISVSIDKEKLRRAKAQAKEEGLSLSAVLSRGLEQVLDARARLDAALELYGPEGWPTAEERRAVVESWSLRTIKARARRGGRAA